MKRSLVPLFLGITCLTVANAVSGATPAIIPLPQSTQVRAGTFTLCQSQPVAGVPTTATLKILVDPPSLQNGQYLAALLFKSTGCRFQIATNSGSSAVKNAILLTTVNASGNLGAEGYQLTVAPDSVVISAPAEAGVFYGEQTLLQLLPPQVLSPLPVQGVPWTCPCVVIQDQPRFPWRGWMLDVARHFLTKDEVKTAMDLMALHKLNTLHLHLVDDQGWRVQILAYPNLTQTGGWRPTMDYGLNPRATSATNSSGQYGGYYTQADIRDLVAYAQQRFINIVPEIELPCHSTAGLASYPQFGCGDPVGDYNMDNIDYGVDLYSLAGPGSMAFFEEVLTEVMGLFPSQYIHCGGDEVIASGDKQWTTYSYDANNIAALGITGTSNQKITAYQHWFSTNLASFLQASGRTIIGWTEIEAGGTVSNAVLMDWENPGGGSAALATAEAGQYVVMATENYCYLNYYMYTNGFLSGSDVVPDEPYFEVGGNGSTVSTMVNPPLSMVYGFEPIPTGLPPAFTNYILGAEATEFSEFIPGIKNAEFKAFPRLCAIAEVAWTTAALKNYTNFTQRLGPHEQRLSAMGVTYDQTNANVVQIGTWATPVPTTPTNVTYNITPNVTKAGEIDVDFQYTSGSDGLSITSVALLVNGVQVDVDNFSAFTGLTVGIPSVGNLPYFILHLPAYSPGATYTIQATIAGSGGTSSDGTVFLTNFN